MAREIERKFLVKNDQWRPLIQHTQHIQQGYLNLPPPLQEQSNPPTHHFYPCQSSVRVRISNEQAYINIKSLELGISREEFEYPIPLQDAQYMLDNLCIHDIINKKRHTLMYDGYDWEVDEFLGKHAPLMIAEIELTHEKETFSLPNWVSKEVTDCIEYYNSSLIVQFPHPNQ